MHRNYGKGTHKTRLVVQVYFPLDIQFGLKELNSFAMFSLGSTVRSII